MKSMWRCTRWNLHPPAPPAMPMSVDSVSRQFGRLLEEIGLGRIRFHDLRHASATRLLEANVNPKVVSEALGHASVGITLDLYSHTSCRR